MGIPKSLWSSEAPRRILFKTPSSHPDQLKGNIPGKEGEWGEVRNFLTITPGDSGHQESLGTITYGKGQFSKMLLIVTGICGPWCRSGCSPGLPLCFPTLLFPSPNHPGSTFLPAGLPLSHLSATSSKLPSPTFPARRDVCLLWTLQYVYCLVLLRDISCLLVVLHCRLHEGRTAAPAFEGMFP